MTHNVVVIGGGFAGVNVVKTLNKAPIKTLLIDKTNHHLFQPLLYQVASAALSPDDIATPLRKLFFRQKNVSVMMGTVANIDKKGRHIFLETGEKLHYNYLVVATGSIPFYFGQDQWATIAPGLKTINDALKMREKILLSFEKAERISNRMERKIFLTFVLIGAGPTGVEMSGAISEIIHEKSFKTFRHIRHEEIKIYLIDAAPRVLPSFPESLSERAYKALKKRGIEILTKTKVSHISYRGVRTEKRVIATENIFWTAGNQASPLVKTLNTPVDDQGRAVVGPDLSIPGHPEVFVIGDAALCSGKDGSPLPGVASVAMQQGRYVGKIIRKTLSTSERPPFSYFDKGGVATIGKNFAVGYIRKLHFSGFFAWTLWCFIHVLYLSGCRNRLSVILQWGFQYFSNFYNAHIIHTPIDEALKESIALRKKEE